MRHRLEMKTYRAACRYLELSCKGCRWEREYDRDDKGDYSGYCSAVLHPARWDAGEAVLFRQWAQV
jgi:hypothetical protein